MTTVSMARSNGPKTSVAGVPVDDLRGGFRGRLITSDDADYEAARKGWQVLLLERERLFPKKSFGQNFLVEGHVTRAIACACITALPKEPRRSPPKAPKSS